MDEVIINTSPLADVLSIIEKILILNPKENKFRKTWTSASSWGLNLGGQGPPKKIY